MAISSSFRGRDGREVTTVVGNWAKDDITDIQLPEAVQHGDLNPGNIMLDSDQPVLIDFQRLGRWPLGYDLARLAGLLRIRLTDARDRSDWLPFRFSSWCEESAAHISGAPIGVPSCREATYFDDQFLNYATSLPKSESALVQYGYNLGSLWDCIKITSYQDVSTMKRAWALVRAWTLVQVLRKERSKLPASPMLS